MPFKLCKSERRRIDELVDHVKDLSNTVNDLRAEMEAMKICTNIANNDNLNEIKNRVECNTFHKFKRCLQKSLIPGFSSDPTYKMRKKCQQIFSQMPTIIPRPVSLPDNEQPNQKQFSTSSPAKINKRSKKSKTSHTQYLDEATFDGSKRRKQNVPTSLQCRKNINNNVPKAKKLEIPLSYSENSKLSLKDPHRVYNPSCTYDTCNSLKTLRKNENVGQRKRDIAKKKTTETATTMTTSSSIKVVTPKQRLIDCEAIQRRRSVTFQDRQKKISHEKNSPMGSSLSSSKIDDNFVGAKPKNDLNLKRKVNSAPNGSEKKKKKKKISRSVQCSIDCEYLKKMPVHLKNVHTSTHAYNFSPENKYISTQNVGKTRRKNLSSKGTQTTSKVDKYTVEMCPNGRRRYCSKAKRSCFSAGSESSLTSCSLRSISSFCLGSQELGEGLMYRYYKREPISQEEKFKKKQKTKITEEETDNRKKARLFSSRESGKKGGKAINAKSRSNRGKRTYLISPDVTVKKTDQADQCNLDEEQTNSSSDGMSKCQKVNEFKQRKIRKKLKKYNGITMDNEDHQLQNKQQSSLDKHNNYMCTNSQTDKVVPKLDRRSNWTVQKRHKKPTRLTKLRENTSSSSYSCTDETCSLFSDPQISRSDGSVNSERSLS